MPLIDPTKQAKRQARRKARRQEILRAIRFLIEELDELTDDVETAIRDFVKAPGAEVNPDMDKFGK